MYYYYLSKTKIIPNFAVIRHSLCYPAKYHHHRTRKSKNLESPSNHEEKRWNVLRSICQLLLRANSVLIVKEVFSAAAICHCKSVGKVFQVPDLCLTDAMTLETAAVESGKEEDIALITQEEEGDGAASQIRLQPLEISVSTPDGTKVQVFTVNYNEPPSFIRQALQEFQETAPFTNYDFEIDGNVINDYIEIGQYVPQTDTTQCLSLVMRPANYDIKKSRFQLRRVRDLIAYPPTVKGVISTSVGAESEEKAENVTVMKKNEKAPSLVSKFPKADEIFAPATLESFFNNTMLRAGSIDSPVVGAAKLPSECVKSLSASGWNPPPASRRAQGDLFYIEAVTEEAILHITCTPSGFYVNKSTRHSFDPTPNANANFSHELFTTLLGASASLRASWQALCTAVPKVQSKRLETSTALDVVSALYAQGREDQIFLRPQWTVPSSRISTANAGEIPPLKGLKHSFDLSRLHDNLGDQFGAEDPGAPREW